MYTLKGINVRLFLAQKSGKTAENSRKRGNWAVVPTPNTESEARHRHRLRVRKANNSSLLRLKACSKKAGCPAPERTIVQSEAEPDGFVQLGARRQSEQSQKSANFFQPGATSTREA